MPEIIRTTYPAARRDHRCFGCHETIPRGTHHRVDVVLDPRPFNCRLCATCEEKVRQLDDGDEFGEGELRDIKLEDL